MLNLNESELINEVNPWKFLLKEKNEVILLFPFWRHFELLYQQLCRFDNQFISREMILDHLKTPLLRLVKRVLVYEFHLQRNVDNALSVPEFLVLLSEEKQKLFAKYPMLKEFIDKSFNHHYLYLIELLSRLQFDLEEIKEKFNLDEHALVSINLLGDPHCLGKQVAMIGFDSKSQDIKRIIYKPRDVNLEKSFNMLLGFINETSHFLPIKTMLLIAKTGYGWFEYVEHIEIDESRAEEYYLKYGILLGVCHLLNGRDFHLENVVAAGTDPVIIDLECLFSVPVTQSQYDRDDFPSIFETLLIPNNTNNGTKTYDFSAVLSQPKQQSFIHQYKVCGDFSKIIYIEKQEVFIKPGKNLLINCKTKKPIHAAQYSTCIAEGYCRLMHWLNANRELVIAFIAEHFKEVKTRLVFRPTFLYARILLESFHPNLLSDVKKYYQFLGQLPRLENKIQKAIFYHECADLLNGDIPYFSTLTNHSAVKNSQEETINWQTKYTGLQRVIERINCVNDKFIETGMKQILASFEVISNSPGTSSRSG